MKANGVLYVSFKYGDSERMEHGRFFNDLNETLFRGIFTSQPELELARLWTTQDARKERRGHR